MQAITLPNNDGGTAYGDVDIIYDNARGGNDTLTGGAYSDSNILFGDAGVMRNSAVGGNDILTGGAYSSYENRLYGDAAVMYDNARGGNDILTGGEFSTNYLYGDAFTMYNNAVGGNDTLISGTGTDYMWGDAAVIDGSLKTGADTFVFKPDSGTDFIYDFRHSDGDRIDISAYGYTDFSQLSLSENGSDAVLNFGGGNSVTLVGMDYTTLIAADFKFA